MSNFDLMERNETNKNSKGGTELLQERLYDGSVPRELLEQFQIVCSRLRVLDETKFRIYWAHDLPGDPESEFLKNGGWNKFHKIVFVSNWQMQAYINYYGIPWSHCIVIENSVYDPRDILAQSDPEGKIRLIYTSTPHRGLNILYPVFDALCKKYENVLDLELNVYSSFKLYGWEQRDEQYRELFNALEAHPKINYYGTADNHTVRKALVDSDIFAYPSIWQETSCLCLIEAMQAGLMCVHPNYGALPETACGDTMMYQWHEDLNTHANIFFDVLDHTINIVNESNTRYRLAVAANRAIERHNWPDRGKYWEALMKSIIAQNPSKTLSKGVFSYGS